MGGTRTDTAAIFQALAKLPPLDQSPNGPDLKMENITCPDTSYSFYKIKKNALKV
jgi:hypothetical protein